MPPPIVEALAIADVKLITPARVTDDRGYFSEVYNRRIFEEAGIHGEFVQDNQSLSVRSGIVRGLHFQIPPFAQGKLVRVVRGAVFDVAADIRQSSPTRGQYVSAILSAENACQIWIPPGFAHGFCTLEDRTEVVYKVTDYYAPDCDKGIVWDDPDIAIEWPISAAEVMVSEKDRALPRFSDVPAHFD